MAHPAVAENEPRAGFQETCLIERLYAADYADLAEATSDFRNHLFCEAIFLRLSGENPLRTEPCDGFDRAGH